MTWIQTHTRRRFDLMDPRADDVDIEDIAHALGHLCRFGGHSKRFYSVAEHSVHVSRLVPPEYQLAGLMHDAAEAYVQDMVRPLKVELERYREIEHGIMCAIANRFNFFFFGQPSVKDADNAMLALERDHPFVMNGATEPWAGLPDPPKSIYIENWAPLEAKRRFLIRFVELTERVGWDA